MVRSNGSGCCVWFFEFVCDVSFGGAQHRKQVRAVVRASNCGGSHRLRRLNSVLFATSSSRFFPFIARVIRLRVRGKLVDEHVAFSDVSLYCRTCSDEVRIGHETRRGGGAGSRGIGRLRSEQIRFEPEMYAASNSTLSTPNFTSSVNSHLHKVVSARSGDDPSSQQTSESRSRARSRPTWNGCVSRACVAAAVVRRL